MFKFILTLIAAVALSVGAADSAFAQSKMSEYETQMLEIAKVNAAYSRCGVIRTHVPFQMLSSCLARFGVTMAEEPSSATVTPKTCTVFQGQCQ